MKDILPSLFCVQSSALKVLKDKLYVRCLTELVSNSIRNLQGIKSCTPCMLFNELVLVSKETFPGIKLKQIGFDIY